LLHSNANKTGLMTLGVSAFALVPLQSITNEKTAAKMIQAQAKKIAKGNYDKRTKVLSAIQLAQLNQPHKYGLAEFVAFPGFFTTICE
jgi:hypothetical protein